MNPEEVARLIAQATDDQLAEGMRANRELILEQIFASMRDRIDPVKTADIAAVVEWRIHGREDGGVDRWQVHIERGSCRVERDGSADPEVAYEIGPVDFLKLVTGNESGPKLFLFGRLRIHGNLVLAARMPSLFKVPESREG
jgi:putative sterol carrier protein